MKKIAPLPVSDGRLVYGRYRVICGDCNKTHRVRMQAGDALLTIQCPKCDSTCIVVESDVEEKE